MKKLGFGFMRLPLNSEDVTDINYDELNKMVDTFMKRGFNNAGVIKGRIHVDLYLLIRQYMRLERYTLERVYQELFNEEKVDIPGEKIYQYWDSDDERLEKLFEYSMDDAVSTTKIGDKITPLTIAQSRLVGQPLFDIARMTTGQMIEWYLMLKAYEKNNIIPNIKVRTNQLYTIKELVKNNNLGAFIFNQVIEHDSSIVGIPLKDAIDLEIVIASRKDAQLNNNAKDFLKFIIECQKK